MLAILSNYVENCETIVRVGSIQTSQPF